MPVTTHPTPPLLGQILGIPRSADEDKIKRAYKKVIATAVLCDCDDEAVLGADRCVEAV